MNKAGYSAETRARLARNLGDQLRRRYREAMRVSGRYAAAAEAEREVAARLAALVDQGWRLLVDRQWPGTRAGNVDMLLAGPGGVFVVDVKNWRHPPEINDGRLYAGERDAHDEVGKLLEVARLTEEALAPLRVSPVAIAPLMVFARRRLDVTSLGGVRLVGTENLLPAILERPRRMTSGEVATVVHCLAEAFPEYDAATLSDGGRQLGTDDDGGAATTASTTQGSPATWSTEGLFEIEDVVDATVRAAMVGPVEKWMTFLHPSQTALVHREWQGAARISGPAGTGKTVVGLHRAAYLARSSPGPLLYLTFVNNLPRVHGEFLRRIAPEVAPRIEFSSLHSWARGLLAQRGISIRLRSGTVDAAFGKAWLRVGGAKGPLAAVEPNPHYWREEIDYVIKGRGIDGLNAYLDVVRHGRRTALRREHRQAVWELYEEYQRILASRDVRDFNDVLILALDEVERAPVDPAYGSVIVDEVQDLTLVGLRLVRAIAGNGPNRLLLIGDGQQSIYPGGYRLSEAGLVIRGQRNQVLKVNYRNASEIWQAATAIVAQDPFVDVDGPEQAGLREVGAEYSGGVVERVTERTTGAHDEALLSALCRYAEVGRSASLDVPDVAADVVVDTEIVVGLTGSDSRAGGGRYISTPLGDCALLCRTRREVERYEKLLQRRGLPTLRLEEYDGRTVAAIKIGTYQRVKGLEFKHVFLPRYDAGEAGSAPSDGATAERMALRRRQLFVAMTRARDSLWLGSVSENSLDNAPNIGRQA